MSYSITHDLLEQLGRRSQLDLPDDEMIFFGIRGCVPVDPETHTFAESHSVRSSPVTYKQPRCTLGQWLPAEKRIAIYPGSTCPNEGGIKMAAGHGGDKANLLLTGYYLYTKGKHLASKPTRGHRAFVQNGDRIVLRNSDDMDFDFEDRVWLGNPGDNLHAGWCPGIDGYYSSLGCQVVVGYPTTLEGTAGESGPWKEFRRAAYQRDQEHFRYLLINGWEAEAMASAPRASRPVLIRFGSTGPLVGMVQKALLNSGFLQSSPDNECGPETTHAIIRFQKEKFGAANTDGIVGPQTAAALGITNWPSTNLEPINLDHTTRPEQLVSNHPKVSYTPPKFAAKELGAESGVPWHTATPWSGLNSYQGMVRDSLHIFGDINSPSAVYYESKFAIDGDGAGGNREGDAAFQAHTSLRNEAGGYMNSRKSDFIVIPLPPKDQSSSLQQFKVGLGDLGVIVFKNGNLVPVIYGDYGPRGKIGEGSMAAAKKLGINPDPNIGGIDAGEIPDGIAHLVFPGSADLTHIEYFDGTKIAATARTHLTQDEIANKAMDLLAKLRENA
jgi:hypothetical protein